MAKLDYYEVLGVERGVDGSVLKKAYRKLALEFHPDRNPDDPGAEDSFKQVSEAYSVLSDPEKRQRYDQFGHAGVHGPGAGGMAGDFGDLGGFQDLFSDLFGDIFGGGSRGGRRRGRGQRGADLRYNLDVDLVDVLNGCEPTIEIPKMRPCEGCEGSGAAPGSEATRCSRCEGAGQIVFQQGFFRVNRTCDLCGGAGEVIKDHCRDCRGAGRIEGAQTISVKVPPGVEHGSRLRLVGEGEAGIAGGPAGDLYVVINESKHAFFERDGVDLHCDVPIPFVHAALGTEVEVPTLEATDQLAVPEGTQSGTVFRLKSEGLPPLHPRMPLEQLHKMRGDLYVRIFVEVPTRLNARQRELLEEFAEESHIGLSPVSKSFVDKLRDFFD